MKGSWLRSKNIKKHSKSFFAYVRGRSCATRKLGPLTDNCGNLTVESSKGMSEFFSEAFGKLFTKENVKDIPEAIFLGKEDLGLGDIFLDEETVLQTLEKLRDDKAVGADELVPRFLDAIIQELFYPLTILFCSITADLWQISRSFLASPLRIFSLVCLHSVITPSVLCTVSGSCVTADSFVVWSLLICDEVNVDEMCLLAS